MSKMSAKTNYYQYGNAAVSLEPAYAEPAKERKKEEKRRKLYEQNVRRRAHKRSLRLARLTMFSVTLGFFVVVSMLFVSVRLQNEISDTKKEIRALEDNITVINMTNDATKSRIDTSVNLNYVKDKALYEMGMVYAGSDHIVYYEMDNSDYMIKY